MNMKKQVFSNFPLGKKTIVYLVMGLLLLSVVLAASVSRDLPRRADPNSDVKIKLQISGADSSGVITVEEDLPAGVSVKDWSVTGATEAKADITTREKDGRYGWSFTPSAGSVTVEYTIAVGSSDLTLGTLVYFDPSGQGKVDSQTLNVGPITCGDGICEGDENSDNCEADCPKPAVAPPTPEPEVEVAEGKPATGIIIVVAIVLIGIIIFFATRKKKKE